MASTQLLNRKAPRELASVRRSQRSSVRAARSAPGSLEARAAAIKSGSTRSASSERVSCLAVSRSSSVNLGVCSISWMPRCSRIKGAMRGDT